MSSSESGLVGGCEPRSGEAGTSGRRVSSRVRPGEHPERGAPSPTVVPRSSHAMNRRSTSAFSWVAKQGDERAALVCVPDQPRSRSAPGERHLESVGDELGVYVIGDAPADDPTRVEILDGDQVEPPGCAARGGVDALRERHLDRNGRAPRCCVVSRWPVVGGHARHRSASIAAAPSGSFLEPRRATVVVKSCTVATEGLTNDYGILGPLEVVADGRSVRVTAFKQRLLLAALLVRGNGVVSVGQLVDCLWPERASRASGGCAPGPDLTAATRARANADAGFPEPRAGDGSGRLCARRR